MIERFVEGMVRNPDLSVLTCFVKAFKHEEGLNSEQAEFIYMPTGGPFVLSCFENVYGDTNAIFRTRQFRDFGGFETDPGTFIEDWETFVKLAASGHRIDVIPEALFHYRLRGDNRSLVMSGNWSDIYTFLQRMIRRRFVPLTELSPLDTEMLWQGIVAFGLRRPHFNTQIAIPVTPAAAIPLRYRLADKLNACLKWVAPIHWLCKSIVSLVAGGTRGRGAVTLAATEPRTEPTSLSPGEPMTRPKRLRKERVRRAA